MSVKLGTHRTRVHDRRDTGFLRARITYQARCDTCGWISEWQGSKRDAEQAGFDHEMRTGPSQPDPDLETA